MTRITLKLGGNPDDMDARALSQSVDALLGMIASVQDEPDVVTIAELRLSSYVVTLDAPDDAADCVMLGLEALHTDKTLPRGWNATTVAHMKKLGAAASKHGVADVHLVDNRHDHAIDSATVALAEQVRDAGPKAVATVTGHLYRYSNPEGGSPTASVRDEVSDALVTIVIPGHATQQVISLLDDRVTVRGILSYEPWTGAPTRIQMRGIARAPRSVRTSIASGRGLLADLRTPHFDSVAIVREVRDAQ